MSFICIIWLFFVHFPSMTKYSFIFPFQFLIHPPCLLSSSLDCLIFLVIHVVYMTGIDWNFLTLEPVRAPQWVSHCIIISCLSFIDLHLLVQCQPLPLLLYLPEDWILLLLPYLKESFFLLIAYLKLLLKWPFLQQFKYLTLWCLLISLKIAFLTLVLVLQSNVSTLIVCKIH